jgi:hypothetical protein
LLAGRHQKNDSSDCGGVDRNLPEFAQFPPLMQAMYCAPHAHAYEVMNMAPAFDTTARLCSGVELHRCALILYCEGCVQTALAAGRPGTTCTRLPLWSNPDRRICGIAMRTPEKTGCIGPTNKCGNSRNADYLPDAAGYVGANRQ